MFSTSMQVDLDVYKGSLEQQSNMTAQVRSLHDKLTQEKRDFEEVCSRIIIKSQDLSFVFKENPSTGNPT